MISVNDFQRKSSCTTHSPPHPSNTHTNTESPQVIIQTYSCRLQQRLLFRNIAKKQFHVSQLGIPCCQVQHQGHCGNQPWQKERPYIWLESPAVYLKNSLFLCSQQPKCKLKTIQPGPGTYNSGQLYKSNSSVRLGGSSSNSLRIQFLNDKSLSKNPGPGAYQPKVVKLKGGKMCTNSKRFERDNKENQPGPRTYNLAYTSDITSKAPKITLKTTK